MSCRRIEITVCPLPFSGHSSHGTTCCVCGRSLTALYLRVMIQPQLVADHVRITDRHTGQVCSEGCVAVFAKFIVGRYGALNPRWMPLCPAHSCVEIVNLPHQTVPDGHHA